MLYDVLEYFQNTRVPTVADNITRSRFLKLRSRLMVIDYNMVCVEEKSLDRFRKVSPLMNRVLSACRMNGRSHIIWIDEQMIPSSGLHKFSHDHTQCNSTGFLFVRG